MQPATHDALADLRAMLLRFDDAVNRRDAAAISAFFAADATFTDAFGGFSRGSEAIGEAIAAAFAAELFPDGRVRFELVGLRMLGEEFAFADLAQHVEGLYRPDGGRGQVTLSVPALFTRSGGAFSWLDARPHYRAARPG